MIKLFEDSNIMSERWDVEDPFWTVKDGKIWCEYGRGKFGWNPHDANSVAAAAKEADRLGVMDGGMCSSSCDFPHEDGLPGLNIRDEITKMFVAGDRYELA